MERLEKYERIVNGLTQQAHPIPPEVLFRLNRALEIELMLGETEIGNRGRQIQFIEERINCAKLQEEASSSAYSQPPLGENLQQAESQLVEEYQCTHPQCSLSFPKLPSLLCHEWLSHRQPTWEGSLNLELMHGQQDS